MLRSHAIIEKISLQSWESFSLEKKEKRNKNRESRAWRDLHRIFELYAHISTHGSNALCKFSSSFGYFFVVVLLSLDLPKYLSSRVDYVCALNCTYALTQTQTMHDFRLLLLRILSLRHSIIQLRSSILSGIAFLKWW